MEQTDVKQYADLMDEVKRRVVVIDAFGCRSATTPFVPTNVESVYLQLRKILELIAMGSLVANKVEYSKVYSEFSKCWNAKYLLRDIERINPNFYPQPIIEKPSSEFGVKMKWENKKDGFLTKEDFLKLYEKCGKILHAANPFGSKIDYIDYEKSINNWRDKIIGLLNTHIIKLVNNPRTYLIHMKEDGDEKVHFYIFSPSNPPAKSS